MENPQNGLDPIIKMTGLWESTENDELTCQQQDAEEFTKAVVENLGSSQATFNVCKRITYNCEKCGKVDKTVEIDDDVTLQVPVMMEENDSLQEKINNLFQSEKTEKICKIRKCGSKLTSKVEVISLPPKVLIIKLNRCNDKLEKIDAEVNIQKNITFENKQYKLKSFIRHVGESVYSGHYTAFSHSNDETIDHYDDMGLAQCPDNIKVSKDSELEERKQAYILFYQQDNLNKETTEKPESNLSTPTRKQRNRKKQESIFTGLNTTNFSTSTPSSPRNFSPKQQLLQRHNQDVQKDNSIQFFASSIKDMFYIGKVDQDNWDKEKLKNFYVHILNTVVLHFRTEFDHLNSKTLIEFMLKENPRINFVAPVLSYKGTQIKENQMMEINIDDERPTFIFSPSSLPEDTGAVIRSHPGKLWTCQDCILNGKEEVGNTKLSVFEKNHKNHRIFEGKLLENKKSWGKNMDRGGTAKPHGCPPGHNEHVKKKNTNSMNPVSVKQSNITQTSSLKKDQTITIPTQRARYQRSAKNRKQYDSDNVSSDSDIDHPRSNSKIRGITQLKTLTDATAENRAVRREKGKENLREEFETNKTKLNEEDQQFLETYIIAPANRVMRNYANAQAEMNKQTRQELLEGKTISREEDKKFQTTTRKSYEVGAHLVLRIMSNVHRKEVVHFSDFLAFGDPDRLIKPRNIINEIMALPSGNKMTRAAVGYKLILEAQMGEALNHREDFKEKIHNWQEMNQKVLEGAIDDKIESFR